MNKLMLIGTAIALMGVLLLPCSVWFLGLMYVGIAIQGVAFFWEKKL